MREILFRGKTPDGRWVYGDLTKDPIEISGEKYTEYSIRGYDEFTTDGAYFFEIVIQKTIGQYTGMKDKNGKMIFEGDIITGWIHDEKREFIVRYESGKFNCGFLGVSNTGLGSINIWYKGIEIIGNIHDNPGLLK